MPQYKNVRPALKKSRAAVRKAGNKHGKGQRAFLKERVARTPQPAVSNVQDLFLPLSHKKEVFLENDFLHALRAAWPLKSAHKAALGADILELSRLLTVGRAELRTPYWSSPGLTSAYLYYFLPWNLVRLCRLFAGLTLPEPSKDQPSLLVDMGSGPLTVALALWIAKPEWRDRPITVAAVDCAGRPPRLGRDILEALAKESNQTPWQVHTIQAPLEQAARQVMPLVHKGCKPWLITAANVLNEIPADRKERGDTEEEESLGKQSEGRMQSLLETLIPLFKAGSEQTSCLFVEPGTRLGGITIMELRSLASEMGFSVHGPCTHQKACPLRKSDVDDLEEFAELAELAGEPVEGISRLAGRTWCHFTFTSAGAPQWLTKLSRQAGLDKETLSLAWLLFSAPNAAALDEDGEDFAQAEQTQESFVARVISQPFKVPGQAGLCRYGCSQSGLLLLEDSEALLSGATVTVQSKDIHGTDEHSGAQIVRSYSHREPKGQAAKTPTKQRGFAYQDKDDDELGSIVFDEGQFMLREPSDERKAKKGMHQEDANIKKQRNNKASLLDADSESPLACEVETTHKERPSFGKERSRFGKNSQRGDKFEHNDRRPRRDRFAREESQERFAHSDRGQGVGRQGRFDRPRREFDGENVAAQAPEGRFGNSRFDRPRREFGGENVAAQAPEGRFGNSRFDRPRREFAGENVAAQAPEGRFGNSRFDRPRREFGGENVAAQAPEGRFSKPRFDRPRREFGGENVAAQAPEGRFSKPRFDRPRREFAGENVAAQAPEGRFSKPRFEKRPLRRFDKPWSERPQRRFDKQSNDRVGGFDEQRSRFAEDGGREGRRFDDREKRSERAFGERRATRRPSPERARKPRTQRFDRPHRAASYDGDSFDAD